MSNSAFQVFKSFRDNQYCYHLRTANYEIILNGESYTTKRACFRGIASVKANARNNQRYERKNARRNFTFNLKAANGKIIGRSENYTTAKSREKGIAAIRRIAASSVINYLGELLN